METETTVPPEIFWHCGMMRTGTTYLQSSVFPFFEGLHYIRKDEFAHRSAILNAHPQARFLISYEVYQGVRGAEEIRSFARQWPSARPILVLRQQGDWLRSEYKRLLKNGAVREFSEVWDPGNPAAIYQPSDLQLGDLIACLEASFEARPVLLLYENLRSDGLAFIKELAQITGASFGEQTVGLAPKHVSYGDRELRAFRAVTRFITLRREVPFQPVLLYKAQRLFRDLIRYLVLYGSKILPMGQAPLVSEETLSAVDTFYQEDWAHCRRLASRDDPANKRS